MMRIKFICHTCEYRNRVETGVDGYEQRQTEFESFTEAWQHLFEIERHQDEVMHDMEAVVESSN